MSKHHATIVWERGPAEFTYDSYSRDHVWSFEGGVQIAASAAPFYLGSASLVDPEEAYVAALASCHMLTLLAIAARKRLVVDRYSDAAVGFLEQNQDGKLAVARVILKPRIVFGSSPPTSEDLKKLHSLAHENCFIANSVHTAITVEFE